MTKILQGGRASSGGLSREELKNLGLKRADLASIYSEDFAPREELEPVEEPVKICCLHCEGKNCADCIAFD